MGTEGGSDRGDRDRAHTGASGQGRRDYQAGAHPAALYERLADGRLACHLCAHHCRLAAGQSGVCQVRRNEGGRLVTQLYGRVISQNVDPIEKKPLYHFYPGSRAYSIAAPGCNFHCRWCQNWSISQRSPAFDAYAGFSAAPGAIVAAARESGSQSIAYTYTEPTVFFEYALDTAREARRAGLGNIFITNGYLSAQALDALEPWLDAANVDLKAFRDRTYRRYVGARLQPVLDTMKRMKSQGTWLEVTTLVITRLNDDPQELRDAARFIALELGIDTPWHISRFFPHYQMNDRPPTPLTTLEQAREIGMEAGLRYVYVGNVARECNTSCHGCGRTLIRRRGYSIVENRVHMGRCPSCRTAVAGLGLDHFSFA